MPQVDAWSNARRHVTFHTQRGSSFGPLTAVFEDVWWAWGTTRFFPGAEFPRNMTVIRQDGHLVVIHPVMLPPPEQRKLEALGPIEHIVRLGDYHGMDDALYLRRYGATLWAPRGAYPHEGAPVGRELAPGGPLPLCDAALLEFDVARAPELVLHVNRHGGGLLTCDSIQNWERTPEGCTLLGALMSKLMGFRGRACIGPGWRKFNEPKTGPGFGPRFHEILALEFRHLLSAHGPPVLGTARDDLSAVVRRTYPR